MEAELPQSSQDVVENKDEFSAEISEVWNYTLRRLKEMWTADLSSYSHFVCDINGDNMTHRKRNANLKNCEKQ